MCARYGLTIWRLRMNKVLTIKAGDLIGNLYKNTMGGYYYKIYFKKQTKGQLVGQSYVYFYSKEDCLNKMKTDMKTILNINKDLFDLEKLENI